MHKAQTNSRDPQDCPVLPTIPADPLLACGKQLFNGLLPKDYSKGRMSTPSFPWAIYLSSLVHRWIQPRVIHHPKLPDTCLTGVRDNPPIQETRLSICLFILHHLFQPYRNGITLPRAPLLSVQSTAF